MLWVETETDWKLVQSMFRLSQPWSQLQVGSVLQNKDQLHKESEYSTYLHGSAERPNQ